MHGAACGSRKARGVPLGCRRVGDAFLLGWDPCHPGEGSEVFSLLKQQRNVLKDSCRQSMLPPRLCPTWHGYGKL